jgi:uncharacterized membrane protein
VSEGDLEYETRGVERLTFFSDAVVAIAITLLAIDLPVPDMDKVAAFWAQVRHNDGHYAAFLISFVVIAVTWSNHHEIFRYLKHADPWLRTVNMAWLLTIVLNPFATKLLTGSSALDTHALRFGFYALLQTLESAALFAMLRHMVSCRQAPDAPRPLVNDLGWRTWSVLVGFGLSIPVFFVTPDAWVLWIAGPLLLGRLHWLTHRNHPSPKDEPPPPAAR